MPMKQPHTDFGEKGETGEKEPKGVRASDAGGEKKVKVPQEDREVGKKGASGEVEPKGASSSDRTGETRSGINGGVGMGMHDAITGREAGHAGKQDGKVGEFNSGRQNKVVYTHERGYK